ncbi:MAG: hypothetical protein MUO77_05295 [Anaerolineales bacterium]|nr:hypothetical protein [Anaerolineales bacterium]
MIFMKKDGESFASCVCRYLNYDMKKIFIAGWYDAQTARAALPEAAKSMEQDQQNDESKSAITF